MRVPGEKTLDLPAGVEAHLAVFGEPAAHGLVGRLGAFVRAAGAQGGVLGASAPLSRCHPLKRGRAAVDVLCDGGASFGVVAQGVVADADDLTDAAVRAWGEGDAAALA